MQKLRVPGIEICYQRHLLPRYTNRAVVAKFLNFYLLVRFVVFFLVVLLCFAFSI